MCGGCSEYQEHPKKIRFHKNSLSCILVNAHGIPHTKGINELVYMRNTQCWIRMSRPLFLIGGGSFHVGTTEMSFVCNPWKLKTVVWARQINANVGTESVWLCTYFSSNCTTVFSSWQQFFFSSSWQQGGRFDTSSSWQWFCCWMKNEVNTPSSSQACVNTGIPMLPKNNSALKKIRISGFTV